MPTFFPSWEEIALYVVKLSVEVISVREGRMSAPHPSSSPLSINKG